MRRVADIPRMLRAGGGLLVWAAHFGFVYTANAIACERGLAGRDLLGQPLMPVLVLGATALALAAVALIGLRAWRRLAGRGRGEDAEAAPHFLAWLTVAIASLAALAILWEGLPALFLRPCP